MDLDALFKQTDTVALRKVGSSPKLDFTSVSVDDELLRESALKGLLPLCCHRLEHGRWVSKRFLPDSRLIRIGRRLGKADLVIDGPYVEDVQVTLQIFGGRWFVIESGIYNLLSVNGMRRRQASLDRWSSCLLQIGEAPVLINIPPRASYAASSAAEVSAAQAGSVESAFYRLVDSNGLKHPFSLSHAALIGSSPDCDFKVEGEEFAAVVSCFENVLYLCPVFNTDLVKVEGVAAKKLQPLKNGSRIDIGSSSFSVEVSPGVSEPSSKELPSMLDVELCLLEVDDDFNCGEILRLPPAGEIFSVGRGDANYLRVNSKNISREHAKAKVNSTNLVVEDCYSRNGTFINGERVQRRCARPGDIIRFAEKSYLLSFAPLADSVC